MIDLQNTKIKMIPKANQVKYLKEKGYVFNKGEEIEVPLSDLPPNSHMQISVPCDICGEIRNPALRDYLKTIAKDDFYCCPSCAGIKTKKRFKNYSEEKKKQIVEKRRDTTRKKYGCDNTSQLATTKEKTQKTCLERYNCKNVSQSPIIQEKIIKNNLEKYGTEHFQSTDDFKEKRRKTNIERYGGPAPIYSPEVKEKIFQTNLERYGSPYVVHNPEVYLKMISSKYKNKSQKTSTQQEYLACLYNFESNCVIGRYTVDLLDKENNIIIEYDGGGHFLSVKTNLISEEKFKNRELIREKELRKKGYKIIRIISEKDVLPSDEILLKLYLCAKEYFNNTNHTWIIYNLDESIIRNAIYLEGISYDFGVLSPVNNHKRNIQLLKAQ